MEITDLLLESARADSDVLATNLESGDRLEVPRPVEFRLIAENKKSAELLASLVEDGSFGEAALQATDDGRFVVFITIIMPVTQNVLGSVSGFMVFLSSVFDAEYDGWEAELRPVA